MKNLPPLPGITQSVTFDVPAPQPLNKISIESCNGDPLLFMTKIMDHPEVDIRMRMEAAKVLMPFKYAKLGETGKKEQQKEKAGQVGKGRYAARPAPGATVN